MTALYKEIDVLANRFNYEPVVVFGATQQEIVRGGLGIVVPTCLVVGFLLLPLFGHYLYGLAAGIVVGMGLFIVVFKALERYRKGRQIGYLTQLLQRNLSKRNLAYHYLIHRSGTWMIGRLV